MSKSRQLLLVLILLVAPVQAMADAPGDAGALFLRLGMGGRASGMGDAFTAVAKDASSAYWNPAAMAAVLGTRAMFMHQEYIQSLRLEQGALTHETDFGTLGLSFTGLYMDDLDRYEDTPSAIPLGTFSAYDFSASVGFARYIVPNLSAGISAKIVYENIDEVTASGVAFDLGVYHISRIRGVKFAAVIANLGAPIKFTDERFEGQEFALPRMVKIGASWERRYPTLDGAVLAALDIVLPNDGEAKQHLGLEVGYRKQVFVRGGFKAGYDSQGATFGLGVKYEQFNFDYGVLLMDNDLGDSHRFSLSLQI